MSRRPMAAGGCWAWAICRIVSERRLLLTAHRRIRGCSRKGARPRNRYGIPASATHYIRRPRQRAATFPGLGPIPSEEQI